jgi:hypothetical protein
MLVRIDVLIVKTRIKIQDNHGCRLRAADKRFGYQCKADPVFGVSFLVVARNDVTIRIENVGWFGR